MTEKSKPDHHTEVEDIRLDSGKARNNVRPVAHHEWPKELVEPTLARSRFAGCHVPDEFYFVMENPVALAGMAWPIRVKWKALRDAGIHHVICLSDQIDYQHAPLKRHIVTLEDLYFGGGPSAENEEQLVIEAATLVIEALRAREGVVVHCDGGTGRTGTVMGVALVMMGYDPEEMIAYFDRLHRTRCRTGWPDTPWQGQMVRRAARLTR